MTKFIILFIFLGSLVFIAASVFQVDLRTKDADAALAKLKEKKIRTRIVEIEGLSFNPKKLEVNVGTRVTWVNRDKIKHSATANDKSFDTGILGSGEIKSVILKKRGQFEYHSSTQPFIKGTIIVK